MLRKFGLKVFYGDATRLDLLHAAGAAEAKLIINAIDNVEDSLALTDIVRQHFPGLRMIARARNVRHFVELRSRGVELVERELFEASLRAGRQALEVMGFDRFRARDMTLLFRRNNIRSLETMIPVFADEERLLSAARAGREELEALINQDRQHFEGNHSSRGWH